MSTDRYSHSSRDTSYSSKAMMFMIENLLHLDNNTTAEASPTTKVNQCHNQQSKTSRNITEHHGLNDSQEVDSNLKMCAMQKEEHWNDSRTKKRLHSESDEDESKTNTEEGCLHKKKKSRTTFTNKQIEDMKCAFSSQRYLPASQRKQLATRLQLSDQQVKTWFQNRRMKDKRFSNNDESFVQKPVTSIDMMMTSPWSYHSQPIITDMTCTNKYGEAVISPLSPLSFIRGHYLQQDLSFCPKNTAPVLYPGSLLPKTCIY